LIAIETEPALIASVSIRRHSLSLATDHYKARTGHDKTGRIGLRDSNRKPSEPR
jgi:hypothetical protein